MKIKCTQENLSKALSVVNKAVSVKSSLPILSNILFTAKDGVLSLASSNPAELLKMRERGLISGKAIVEDTNKPKMPQGFPSSPYSQPGVTNPAIPPIQPQTLNQPGNTDQTPPKTVYRPVDPSAPLM